MSDPVNVDAKLSVNKYFVDENHPHIVLAANPDPEIFALLEKACPASLYKRDASGGFHMDYAGCLECGTCRILGLGKVISSWKNPNGNQGIAYRFG